MSRPSRIAVLISVAATLVAGLPGPAVLAATIVKPIVFPVDGTVRYTDDFGAARTGHTHEGNDLMGQKMMRELAAVDGTVLRVRFDNLSTGGNSVTIKGADGWTYSYIHVNNDTPGTDDGHATRAQAFPPEIVPGATVHKGQVVAFMGDSGNAESVGPHLHFEIRQPAAPGEYQGVAIDPYESLLHATTWAATQRWELRRTPTTGAAQDVATYGPEPQDRPLLCDWNGDGRDEVVIYRSGVWWLRSGVTTGSTGAKLTFGDADDLPTCGNIDGDAADEPAVYDPTSGVWTVRTGFGTADPVAWTTFYGGTPNDQPVMGDWNGDGRDEMAIFRQGGTWWVRGTPGPTGATTAKFSYGPELVDRAVVGDWDGNGTDDAAIYRDGVWWLRTGMSPTGTTRTKAAFGAAGYKPVAGRWSSADARSGIGYLRPPSV